MGKVYLVTFGTKGSTHDFYNSAIRLKTQAVNTGWFDDVFAFNISDIGPHNRNMNTTGAGFGWWKPKIVKMVFDKISDDDIVLYLDAGFSLNKNEIADTNFLRYVSNCDSGPGFLGFHLNEDTIERQWTKRDVFKFMDCDIPKYTDTPQIASGAFFVKKNKFGIKLIDEFEYLSGIEHLINEYPSYHKNYDEYINHRHNQSLFSLLIKRRLPIIKKHLINTSEIGTEINGVINEFYPFVSTRIDDTMM